MLIVRWKFQLVSLILHIEVVDYLQTVLESEMSEVLGLNVEHVQEVIDNWLGTRAVNEVLAPLIFRFANQDIAVSVFKTEKIWYLR